MSEQTSQEPTMEEILASIRRIISEDDAPAADAKAEVPAEEPAPAAAPEPEPVAEAAPPPPEPEPAPVAAEPEDEDALELTDKVETHGDLDVIPAAAAAPPPPEPEPAPLAARAEGGLVGATASAAAASAFERLSATIAMPAHGRTLEDVVREMLKPLLQQWLDDNLPGIVQTAVEAEVERIARSVR
jgi:hypothetical protein